jgi:hypothetical protein
MLVILSNWLACKDMLVEGLKRRHKKSRFAAAFFRFVLRSTLTRLETRVALADHEHFAAAAHNLAVAVPLLGGLQRGKHLHGRLLERNETKKARKYNDLNYLSQAQGRLGLVDGFQKLLHHR